jgi:dipeptidase E
MKLLLTSSGLRNPTLSRALLDLAGKPASELKVAFIPTALNMSSGDKTWVVDQLTRIRDMGVGFLDIVDIAAIPKDVWLPRLEQSNVIFVNGGHTTYLMRCFNESGLTKEIPRLLKDRVYVGVSAGSYIATPDIRFNSDDVKEVLPGLHLVDFGLQVHLNSPKFPLAKDEATVRSRIKGCPYTVYSFDDDMAMKIDGKSQNLVGEGRWLKVEPGEKVT